MKAIRTLLLTTSLLALALTAPGAEPKKTDSAAKPKTKPAAEDSARSDLIAHEWGTFTQVVGSDGQPISWWTPFLEGPAELPEFVQPVFRVVGKTGTRSWLTRMETPVIYFYADKPADLTVTVDETKIPTTEVFPGVTNPLGFYGQFAIDPSNPNAIAPPQSFRTWEVSIRPPQDSIGEQMPEVGEQGGHYQHAREVPDAWWVVKPADPENKESRDEVEKFIFYRGAGDASMPRRIAHFLPDSLALWEGERPVFLVESGKSGLRWKRVMPTPEDEESATFITLLPSQDTEARTDEDALVAALVDDLDADGLTREEAVAMVETWRESWLGETGLRVLELMPREWVDATLPLTISPAPAELERVFVARWELLSPELETSVLRVLDGDQSDEAKMAALKDLDLGRFGTAVFDRVADIRDRRFRAQFRGAVANLNRPE